MRKAAQALAFRSHAIGEDLTDKYPNDGALGKCKECDVPDQQPYEKILVAASKKDGGNASETPRSSYRTDEQQWRAPRPTVHGETPNAKGQIHRPKCHD